MRTCRDVPTVVYLNGYPVAVVPADGASPYAAAAGRRRPERPTFYRSRDGRSAMTASVAAAASAVHGRRMRAFRNVLRARGRGARHGDCDVTGGTRRVERRPTIFLNCARYGAITRGRHLRRDTGARSRAFERIARHWQRTVSVTVPCSGADAAAPTTGIARTMAARTNITIRYMYI